MNINADMENNNTVYGNVLTIKTDDNNIKQILHNLFYDILNVEFNLWSWTRNMCKYGDFYLKLEVAEKFGVYHVYPLSVYDMVREEGYDPNNPSAVRYRVDPMVLTAGGMSPKMYEQRRDAEGKITFDNYEINNVKTDLSVFYESYNKLQIPEIPANIKIN